MLTVRRLEEEPQDDPRLMSPLQIRAFAKQGGALAITNIVRNYLTAQPVDVRFLAQGLDSTG